MSSPLFSAPSVDPAAPLLYSYRRCPYAMRARMALLQARRAFRVLEIVLRDKPSELLALSPKGTVPVLHLPGPQGGQVLEQSWDIMRWALESDVQHGGQLAWDLAQSTENLELLQRNDGDFKHHLDRYKYPERYVGACVGACTGDATDQEAQEAQEFPPQAERDLHRSAAVEALLMPLQQRLQAQAFLGGDSPCATDLALFPFVRQFAAVEPSWFGKQPWPALQDWLARWVSSALFQACMIKVPEGAPVSFPGLEGGSEAAR